MLQRMDCMATLITKREREAGMATLTDGHGNEHRGCIEGLVVELVG